MSWERIQEALDYDVEASDLEQLKASVESGQCELWEEGDSTAVTQGIHLQSGKIGVKVIAIAGSLEESKTLLRTIEDAARESGCELLTCVGRRGWKHTAKELGWDNVASVYVKRLT